MGRNGERKEGLEPPLIWEGEKGGGALRGRIELRDYSITLTECSPNLHWC